MKKILLLLFIALGSTTTSFSQQDCYKDTVYKYKFITGTQVKELVGREIYKYDANNNQTENLSQAWNSSSNAWENSNKKTYEYNGNNDLIAQDEYYSWNNTALYYASHYRDEIHYLCLTTGINEHGKKHPFTAFPIPAFDEITVQTTERIYFTIYDLSGRVAVKSFIVHGSKKVPVADLKAGIYLLKADGHDAVRKIVKQ